jgi:bacillaene synthase trans-acting acyltransferase
MFSGQGSQYPGMGRDLYGQEPVFTACLDRCDRITRNGWGVALLDPIYGDGSPLDAADTRVTHPAICAIQYSLAQTLLARGHRPDLLLGYSLGEFVAQLVAEAIPLETGLELLHQHANLMETATPAGGMLAVLETPETLQPLMRDIPELWLGAHNFENHCVATGAMAAVDELQRRLETRQATYQRLPVRRAFHCPLMQSAAPAFQRQLAGVRTGPPRFEIVSATTAQRSTGVEGLWNATSEQVQFLRTVRHLEATYGEGLAYVDLGPSGTLATFVKYIRPKPASAWYSIITPWGGALKNLQAYEASR